MSNYSLIPSPPPELLQQWAIEYWGNPGESIGEGEKYIATQAAQWGADRELEACCEWFICDWTDIETADKLRADRRPKPQSLKEQALAELEKVDMLWDTSEFGADTLSALDTIRRAIEQLPDAL